MPHSQGETWFLAQLKPNAARTAETNLRRQGFATFLPLEAETRARAGKFVTVERPLFPGYIFVGFDVAKGSWRAVNSTAGITRLVSFGKVPAPVPSAIVADLQARCDPAGRLIAKTRLQPGDQVRVTRGPFAELIAEIETVAPDRRVWVLLDVMGGRTRVGLGPDQLRQV